MQKEQHGGRYTRLYNIWLNMKQRCSNPKASHYEYYGGREFRYAESGEILSARSENGRFQTATTKS